MPNKPAALDDPLKGKKTGKWSKYGGSVSGLLKKSIENTWFCQLCGDEVPKEFKPFSYELFSGDFIRICNRCTTIVTHSDASASVNELVKKARRLD